MPTARLPLCGSKRSLRTSENYLLLGTSAYKGKQRKSRTIVVSARCPRDPASEHEANFLLLNFCPSRPPKLVNKALLVCLPAVGECVRRQPQRNGSIRIVSYTLPTSQAPSASTSVSSRNPAEKVLGVSAPISRNSVRPSTTREMVTTGPRSLRRLPLSKSASPPCARSGRKPRAWRADSATRDLRDAESVHGAPGQAPPTYSAPDACLVFRGQKDLVRKVLTFSRAGGFSID